MKVLNVSEAVARKVVARHDVDGDEEMEEEKLNNSWKDFLEALVALIQL